MTGKTHQIIGITAGIGYLLVSTEPSYNPATLGAVLIGSHFASLIPDLDQPAATIWKSIPIFGRVAGHIINPFIEHRNISHSILGLLIFSGLFYLLLSSFPVYWGIDRFVTFGVVVVAYLSHLVADMVTVEGVPLFFPYQMMFGLPPKPFDGARILTGKWFENMVIFPSFTLILILIVVLNWSSLKSMLLK